MLFDPFSSVFPSFGRVGFLPPADVAVSDDDMVLTVDVPGIDPSELEVEMVDGQLVVRGERKRPEASGGTRWSLTERPFGKFERRIELPTGVDPDAITASVDHGVLSLIVPKPEAKKPKTIGIGEGAQQRELEAAAA
jgi:HSP20 family protein